MQCSNKLWPIKRMVVLIFEMKVLKQCLFFNWFISLSKNFGTTPPKKGIFWEFPPNVGPPPPFGNPCFPKKKIWLILHFRPLGSFLVFTKMFTFWSLFWHLLLGIGDPPPLKEKNSQNFLFSLIFSLRIFQILNQELGD